MAAGAELPVPAGLSTLLSRSITLTSPPYNATPDAVKLTDGALAAASNNLTSATAAFTSADVGKQIAVEASATGYSARGIITSGSNAIQQTWVTLKITANAGTFPITFNAQTYTGTVTAGVLPTAASVQAGLEALSTIGVGNVDVTLSGTTYTISLKGSASSFDTNLFSTSAASLTSALNGPTPAALLTTQTWWYGQVGLRVHVPGAGAAGAPLVGWIGYIETVDSRIAYVYDTPPNIDGPQGNPLNATTTVSGVTYNLLNWARGTISAVNSATSVNLSFTNSAGALANLTGLEVHYGTDNTSAVTAWISACRTQNKPGYAPGGTYLCLAGQTSSVAATGLTLFGAGSASEFRHIPVDSEAESARWNLGGTTDTTAGRAVGVHLRDLKFTWPCAHTRGAGTLTGFPQNKTNAGGIFLPKVDGFTLHNLLVENNYGAGISPVNARFGVISNCRVYGSWGNGIDVQNSNSTIGGPGTSDVTVANCDVRNSGDDMYAVDDYVWAGRIRRINFVGCRGYQTRQYGLGRGIAINGGDDILVTGCQVYGTNGANFDVAASKATNSTNTATITTPGGVTTVAWATAQPNITASTTQMRLHKNDGSGTTWIGDVATVSGDGLTVTLTAAPSTGSAATCPFTGANSTAQWGANTDGFRFGVGGSQRVILSSIIGDGSNISPSSDGTLFGAIRLDGGSVYTERVTDVQIVGATLNNCYETGVLVNTIYTSTTSDQATAAPLVSDIIIKGLSINGTGFSGLTALRPWPGIYIRQGSNITVEGARIRNTDDNAVLVANTGISNRIRMINIEASDIGRTYTTGAPLGAAFDPGTSTALYTLHAEQLYLTNPAGTAGGTQYVATAVLGEVPTGSTVRGVNSDIAGQTLLTESASRYRVVVSPVMYRGKGAPEGTVTANVGAIYERTDGSAGATLYVKESGTGNTGWIAYGAPGAQPAPELDGVYTMDPIIGTANAVWPAIGEVIFVRARGNGTLTGINVHPTTNSGNLQVGVYATNGLTGLLARPTGAPLVQSASTAMSGLTVNIANLVVFAASATQAVTHLNYWLAIQVDNTTAAFARTSGLNSMANGFAAAMTPGVYNAGAMPTVSGPVATGAYVPILRGL